ncbi:helix-turn-helix domain-containing protein [Streptomyces triculaminicus]|uniref:helix-turn-helix domain-containing protein n=1 Tax=Streptomyces triculaminicus TaxID=2816232 RepID=UPI0027DC94AD|nr:helix-turn-helix domain-containing protein [Streptomyces triculaminicus]
MHSALPSAPAQEKPATLYPAPEQWLATTPGRIATDGFSWMQAVCWFTFTSAYASDRDHGPRRVSETTVRLAAELTRLSPCRPGITYLVRVLKLSKRTIQYHLAILRETGLLTYRAKGTRVSGQGGQASEFARTIPPAFDRALRLRTGTSDPYIRTVRGIEDAGRPLMKRLAKMAQRALKRPRRPRNSKRPQKPVTPAPRCTPMGGTSSSRSTAGSSPQPPESKLDPGNRSATRLKKPRPARRFNAVGRRYQLARDLIRQVPWLHRASIPRIAWVVRDVSDTGWTTTEVIAVLGVHSPARIIHRPSGFLAHRLLGAHLLYDTPAKREALVCWWRESRQAETDRHTEWEGTWQTPRSHAVARLVRQAITRLHPGLVGTEELADGDQQSLSDDDLREHARAVRQAFMLGDTGLVTSTVDFLGRDEAERLYGAEIVANALRLGRTSGRMSLGIQ